MRKLLIVALVAFCAAFQGEVCAKVSFGISEGNQEVKSGMGEVELEWVLNQVVDQTGLAYSEVRNQYDQGILSISKIPNGYRVNLKTVEGGMGTILIIEGI